MIKVINKVDILEVNGKKDPPHDSIETLTVESHWNSSNLVTLAVGSMKIAVTAKDLIAAIANATNVARF